LLDKKLIGNLQSRVGYANHITDARRLCRILRKHWCRVSSRTALSASDLDEIETAANTLAARLAERSPESGLAARASELRTRAFTRFVDVYDQARRAMEYLRWDEGDANEIVPSLFVRRRRRSLV
jgi:enoyl-CoA hydratase/carnithine racemase